jgi:hypothetical protein
MTRFATLTVVFFLSLTNFLNAQVQKLNFESFDVTEKVRSVKIETEEDYVIKPWSGVQLMVETQVVLENGSMDILGIFIRDGRYSMKADMSPDGNLTLSSRLPKRLQVKYQGQVCYERIKMVIYVPAEFNVIDRTNFIRKEVLVAGR